MSDLSDAQLVQQLQQGSLEALGDLYDRYQRMVYRTALVITGDPDQASDLLQDVFLRLHRFAGHVDPGRPLEPWLYRMTVNLSYTWIKRNRRWYQPLEDLAEWLSGVWASPQDYVEAHDDWDQVQQAVLRLPFAQRVVVVLYYLNDLPLQQIAEILDLPLGTIKSRLHYGRLALRSSLGAADLSESDVLSNLDYRV
jgi:RNA polymerase sigma-70 factor, ECF subfamily